MNVGPDSVSGPACKASGTLLAPNFLNIFAGDDANARTILGWPAATCDRIADALVALHRGEAPGPEVGAILAESKLIGGDGRLTPLGTNLQYNLLEYSWQSNYEVLEGLLAPSDLGPRPQVLDIGCGSGQTLRHLAAGSDGPMVGVDVNIDAMAFGARSPFWADRPVFFCCASAHALPLPDRTFDLIVLRTSVNYFHQRRALREAARVLRPGGWLFCRAEVVWWDVNMISRSKSPLQLLFNLRNLGWGALHALTGKQPEPGGLIRGYRTFATKAGLRRTLEPMGCRLLRYEPSSHGPSFRGRQTQIKALFRRDPAPDGPSGARGD